MGESRSAILHSRHGSEGWYPAQICQAVSVIDPVIAGVMEEEKMTLIAHLRSMKLATVGPSSPATALGYAHIVVAERRRS